MHNIVSVPPLHLVNIGLPFFGWRHFTDRHRRATHTSIGSFAPWIELDNVALYANPDWLVDLTAEIESIRHSAEMTRCMGKRCMYVFHTSIIHLYVCLSREEVGVFSARCGALNFSPTFSQDMLCSTELVVISLVPAWPRLAPFDLSGPCFAC